MTTDPIAALMRPGKEVVLIAGPTASGKSRLALDLAARVGGVIVNADSMQVYAELRILSVRPTTSDEEAVPHRLYGHVAARERYSVGRWLTDVAAVLEEVRESGKVPIIVGGTGLYFKAMTEGLAEIPPVPEEVRRRVADDARDRSSADLHRRLAASDPEDAAAIRASDRSRIIRAIEVFEATGRSVAAWQNRPARPLIDLDGARRLVLDVDRASLHERIAARVERMIAGGALSEATALGALGLDPALPAMKAIGVRELLDHAAGRVSLAEALAGIKTETRRYARRQITWFRNQMADWPVIAADDVARIAASG
jgi:tRNA dimethylallyltransferase